MKQDRVFGVIPDPGTARTLDEFIEALRSLRVWAGQPSYDTIKDRINTAWTAAGRPARELTKKATVVDCFKPGRRRLNTELVLAVVRALHDDVGYVNQWRQALRVIDGETAAAAQVRVQDSLPPDLAGFTGRTAELDQLDRGLHDGTSDVRMVGLATIVGMPGVGKTQLAIHAGHLLARDRLFDRVLFVDLRGFHPDPAQPPADPAGVLDGFLRLLGIPGQQIPHGLGARIAAYHARLSGTRTLLILDNAASVDQLRPLLAHAPGCLTLVTSRCSLTDLHPATHLTVDVFTPAEAVEYLIRAAPPIPAGDDPDAATRIAARCDYLPLALGLMAGHIRTKPHWTLTDHADWLDDRRQALRLDTGIELTLELSYQHLPTERRRLLRHVALHPGHDFDAYAAAALTNTDLSAVQTHLDHLCGHHLLQRGTPGRYTFHDLVRVYATNRAHDEDRPPERRTALTRLFDHYLAAAATAMNALHPAEAHRRPQVSPTGTPIPVLTDPDTARAWLDAERHTMVAVAAHTATHGWPTHTTRLARTLHRYLNGGYHTDALTVHGHAHHAAQNAGDPTGQAHALTDLGYAQLRLDQHGPAAENFEQALDLFRQVDDPTGQARTQNSLGAVKERLGQYRAAVEHYRQALTLYRQAGDPIGEANTLTNLGDVETRSGQFPTATEHYKQALTLHRRTGNQDGEAYTLNTLGDAEVQSGRYGPAGEYLQQALSRYRQLGNRTGEASTLDSLGILHTRLHQPAQATEHHQQALAILRATGERYGQAWALNGLGEAAHAAGRPAEAITHHTAAAVIGDRHQQARAHTGLGHAKHTLGNLTLARQHYQRALTLYTDLDLPQANLIRTHLAALDNTNPQLRHTPSAS